MNCTVAGEHVSADDDGTICEIMDEITVERAARAALVRFRWILDADQLLYSG